MSSKIGCYCIDGWGGVGWCRLGEGGGWNWDISNDFQGTFQTQMKMKSYEHHKIQKREKGPKTLQQILKSTIKLGHSRYKRPEILF